MTRLGATLSAEMSASVFELEGRRCMVASVRDVTERDRLARENEYLGGEIRSELRLGAIVGRGGVIRKVLEQVDLVAPTDTAVLVTGESGTGKELVARAIHEAGARRRRTLVRVNCASIPAELFESEFFGHVKGAFTGAMKDRSGRFELADGGTIFLDEVGEIPIDLQSKLLRVLQDGQFERVGEDRTRKVDVRVVAATNRDLGAAIAEGRFRQDLYYRLSVFPIHIPPLRERREDIPLLAEHCLRQSCARLGVPVPKLTPEQLRALERYEWPGNVRELQNVIERAVILARRGVFRLELGAGPGGAAAASKPPVPASDHVLGAQRADGAPPGEGLTLHDLERMERDLIVRTLEEADWKVYGEDGAAARLGLKPTTLASRLRSMGIRRPGEPG